MTSTIISSNTKKFALLIGINYVGTSSQLNGCINDANNLKTFLLEKAGYLPQNILMLADDGVNQAPTKQNILNAFNTLVNKAVNEGFTELWLSYSGHGSYVTDTAGDETDGRDEVLCPSDYSTAGFIVDDYIYSNLVCKLPSNSVLFSLMDCCHSGSVYDLPHLYTTSLIVNNTNNKHVAKVVSISGCRDDQTSADAYISGKYAGAMTWSFLNAVTNANYNIKLSTLCDNMRVLLKTSYTQVPQLALSDTSLFNSNLMTSVSTSTTTPTTQPVVTTRDVVFKLTVDYWFNESTWNVWSVNENKYIYPAFKNFTSKYQTVSLTEKLNKGSYKLCIRDSYGDGGVTYDVSSSGIVLASGNMKSGRILEIYFDV